MSMPRDAAVVQRAHEIAHELALTARLKLDALRKAEDAWGDQCAPEAYQRLRDSIVISLSIAEQAPKMAELAMQVETAQP
jgi:hypothetical protein